MKIDPPKNINYAAQVIRVPAVVELAGLDNLVGVPVLGHQALTQKGKRVGELAIAFTAETQLSHEYAHNNGLYRESELNADPADKGYLEKNRRIRAIKLRGHRSDALLMPLSSVAFAGVKPSELEEGDTFDHLNGVEICRKYEVPVKPQTRGASKVEKAFRRVTDKVFPMHLDTDAYWRSKHLLDPGREVVITQKLHGTSGRWGVVPALRQKGRIERFLNRWIPTSDFMHELVAGSRKVIKGVGREQNDFYGHDLWSEYGKRLEGLIPEGYVVYGEVVGWTKNAEGQDIPIQKSYTYGLPKGECELYVYRVATVNSQGTLADLSWDGVKEFCTARGLKWTPELLRTDVDNVDYDVEALMDERYSDNDNPPTKFNEEPLPLSDPKTVDEGICLRQEGVVPLILKAKSPIFLAHETRLLDKGEADLESVA